MKNKRYRGGSSVEESSENEVIIDDPRHVVHHVSSGGDDEEYFENSQDLTQLVPRRSDSRSSNDRSPKKKKDKKRRGSSSEVEVTEVRYRNRNGYRIREVDVSEFPPHILAGMKNVTTTPTSECSDRLTAEDWEVASTSEKGGVWILQCPKDVNLSDLLTGKKLSLEGKSTVLGDKDEDDLELTQYVPNNSLGNQVADRQFEAVSVANETSKQGVILLLPDNNKLKLVSAPVQGHIVIRESVKELVIPKIEIPKTKPRKLPSGIKERHPVYGADFTSIIEEMEAAKIKSPRKKKKSSQEQGEGQGYEYQNGGRMSLHFDSASPSKSVWNYEDSSDSSSKKKKKRKKHKHDTDECYGEETSTPATNAYDHLVDFSTPYEDVDYNASKKKSKKRKREEMEEDFETEKHLFEFKAPSSKKAKKSKSKYD